MTQFGIRYEGDTEGRWGRYVSDSVALLNEQLVPEGKAFFFDTIDIRQQVIGGRHCWDMFGWVVPEGDLGRFMPDWLAWRDEDLEEFDYVSVDWAEDGGRPKAVIDYDD